MDTANLQIISHHQMIYELLKATHLKNPKGEEINTTKANLKSLEPLPYRFVY